MRLMDERYPGFGANIFADDGDLHRFVKIFCDGELVEAEGLDGVIAAGAEIEVVAAIAGGSDGHAKA